MSNKQTDTYNEQGREYQIEKLFLNKEGKTDYAFDSFLAEKHGEDYDGLDDDMSEMFDDWITKIDLYKLIAYRKEYEKNKI